MDLSIIVPVYNVEKYLDECLNSLINQDIKDYEVIIINDGSLDNSEKIIQKYIDKYPNFKAYKKENGGLSSARNFGLKYANGKYVTFLDSDDYVEVNGLAKMLDKAMKEDLDLVVADLRYFWDDNSKESYVKKGLNEVSSDIKKSLFLSPLFAWNKLYKKEFFFDLKILYPLNLWSEDIPVTLKAFAKAHKVGYIDEVIYNYRQREASIMSSGYNPKMYDIFIIFKMVIDIFKEESLDIKYKDELEYLFIEHFLVYGAYRFLRCDNNHYKDLMNKAFEFIKEYYPNYLRNPYIKKVLSKKERIFLLTNNKLTMFFWHYYLRRKR